MAFDPFDIHDAKPVPKNVRLVVSSLTDTRYLQQRLERAGVEMEHDRVSMASGEKREYFRDLQQQYDWQSLPMVFADGEFIGGELELLRRLPVQHQLAPPSRVAWWLALSGLLPFVAMVMLFWFGQLPFGLAFDKTFLWSYGPIILSFMAAIQWGAALAAPGGKRQARWYAVSVLPALAAWLAIGWYLQGSVENATILVIFGFIAVFMLDVVCVRAGLLPAWYLKLRLILTVSVALLLVILACSVLAATRI